MNDEAEDLYQEIILDHNRRPANFRPMPDATCRIEADNPLCGDRLELFLKIEGDRIADISFQGTGCAISIASASLLTERVRGETVEAAEHCFHTIHDIFIKGPPAADTSDLGNLVALTGVRRYPMRVKCATLSWHALKAALDGQKGGSITTE